MDKCVHTYMAFSICVLGVISMHNKEASIGKYRERGKQVVIVSY